MNISELNHLENVNESSLVNGGYTTVNTSGSAFGSGTFISADTSSFVHTNDYGDYYYYYGSGSESDAGSYADASAVFGYVGASTSASGFAY